MILVLIFLSFCWKLICTEPCDSYLPLNDTTRSVTYDLPFGDTAGCDRYDITQRWYRFEGDRNMPTFAPSPGKCGTNAPIWIDGILPSEEGNVKTLTACKVGFLSECEESWTIDVKNCGLFNVFELIPISSCEGRYCIDEAQPCPEGTSSDTGFQPCTANALNITLSGYIHPNPFIPTYDPYSPNRMLMFECIFWFDMPNSTVDYYNLLYDVRWDLQDTEFVVKRNLTYSQIRTDGVLKSSEWRETERKMGFHVNCAIRARLSENDPPSQYLEGSRYFAGMTISPESLTITSGESAQIWLYPTVPIACIYNSSYACKLRIEMFDFNEQFSPGSQMYCNDSIVEFTKPSLCGLEIDGWKTWYWHTMNVTVPANIAPNQEYTAILKLRSSGLSYDKLWEDYHLYPIKIQVTNDNLTNSYWPSYYATCNSGMDPWFSTFDWQSYGFNDEGEFVLFRHKTKPIEVHTIQRRFSDNDSWTENCAIAVRAASDVFIIYGCGRPTKWIIRRLNCKVGADYLKIYQRWDSFEIHLPSGTIVNAWKSNNRMLNINIVLSRSDRQDVEGLCGNSNGDPYDDFTSRNGTILVNATLFARSWRVPVEDSLFVAKPREEKLSLSYMYCTCLGETLGELSPNVDCSWQENIPVYPPLYWDYEPCKIRTKRSVDDDDSDDIDVPLDIVSHTEHPEVDTNWKNGWDEVSAKEACLSSFKESPVYEACISLENMNVSADIETCISNIRISGTTEFIQDSLDLIVSQCSLTLRLNISLHDAADENGNNIFDNIFNKMCPNDCKYGGVKTGDCLNGYCVCFDGYAGDDCRINKNLPPTVSGLSEEYVCDASVKGCQSFSIYGDGFYSSDNLKCRLSPGKITDTSIISEGSYTETMASYQNNGEVKCNIAGTVRRRKRSTVSSAITTVYLVSVTTNGRNYSDEVPVIIYDSNCFECTIIESLVLCNLKSDVCIIGNTCQPINSLSCKNIKNNESKFWIMGVIIGILAVSIIILVLIKWKKHKGIIVIPFCQPQAHSNYGDNIKNGNDYDTLPEMTFGSTASLKNVPPVSTGRTLFSEKTFTEGH